MNRIYLFLMALLVSFSGASAAVTIKFKNDKNWSTPHIWAWTDGSNLVPGNFPGPEMIHENDNIWYYTLDTNANVIKFKFNNGITDNGKEESPNEIVYQGPGVYDFNGSFTPDQGDVTETKYVIYYDNSESKWGEVHIHYWPDWSGDKQYVKLDRIGETNYYKVEINEDLSNVNCLFYNGQWANQGGGGAESNTYSSGLKNGYVYKCAGNNTAVVEVGEYQGAFKNYYFYGSMNRWSALGNAGSTIVIHDRDGNDVTSHVFPDGTPSYFTADELNSTWKFQPVTDAALLPEAVRRVTEGQWYVLDFTNLVDTNGDARLCGQFKITEGDFTGADNFGVAMVDNNLVDYLYKKISANTLYPQGVKNSGLQNFQLNANYFTNAKLYFNPGNDTVGSSCSLYIDVPSDSDIHQMYVYYGVVNGGEYGAPVEQSLNMPTQENYYVNIKGFNGTDDNFNPMIDGERQYRWEKYYGEDGNGVTSPKGIHFPYVYRRLIPYGASHRYPIPLTIDIKGRNGHEFPTCQVDCDDIWFVEGDVSVWFRYEDPMRNPDQVGFNIYKRQYNDDNIEIAPATYYTTWQVMDKGVEYDNYTWFKSKEKIDYEWASNTYALFRTSEGANFPVGGLRAIDADLEEARINGADLFYVVPNPDPEIHILYTHLNGTYQLGSDHAGHAFQIEAEFYNPRNEGKLDTTYKNTDHISYAFDVRDSNGTSVAHSDYTHQPYFDGWQPSKAGFYNVIVKVKVDGKDEYSASDIYAVFPAN